jgi:hypothetical protein
MVAAVIILGEAVVEGARWGTVCSLAEEEVMRG